MKVSELIQILEQYDDDLKVQICFEEEFVAHESQQITKVVQFDDELLITGK